MPTKARWLWLEGSPERLNRPRIFRDPARGRLLYRRNDQHAGQAGFDFSGHLFTDCPGCGIVHAVRDERGDLITECSLCRASLTRTPA